MVKNIIKIALTIILLGLLFYMVSWEKFIITVRNANIILLLALIVLWFVTIPLKSIRWNLILSGYGIKETQRKTFLLYWVGSFFNNFFPSSVGGDSYKFFSLNKIWPESKANIASSLILDRAIGMCVMVPFPMLAGLSYLGLNKKFDIIYWGYFIFVILVILLVLSVGFFIKSFHINDSSIPLISKIAKPKYIADIFFSYSDKSGLVLSVTISIVLFMLSCFFYKICFVVFNQTIPFNSIVFIFPIITVAGALPITINGIGLKEGISVFLFSIFGINLEVSLSVSLIARILLILATASGGIGYLFMKSQNIQK